MKPPRAAAPPPRFPPQGEAVTVWLLWALVLVAIAVTYTRLDPEQLYHVSREGLDGGLSRVLVALNFPIALVAIALVLVALDALPRRAWWVVVLRSRCVRSPLGPASSSRRISTRVGSTPYLRSVSVSP